MLVYAEDQIVFDVVHSDLPVLIEQVEGFLRLTGHFAGDQGL